MELDEFSSALERADFFRICDDEQRRLLAFASERQSFEAGDIIYKRGEISSGAYVLLAGEVLAGDSEGGGYKPQKIGERGAVLGEMGLFLTRPRRATLRAASDVELLFVPRSAFTKLMRQYPGLAEKAARRVEEEMATFLDAMEQFRDKD
jgi:CRP-like cAMP-binding protein